jgi:protein O-mannosyl-transferase
MKNASRLSWMKTAGILLLTMLVYLPAMRGGFVFDDNVLITENRLVISRDGLHRFWFTTDAPDYYPLTWSLWWTEWRLWGANPLGYHVLNVLLHATNAILVWLILRELKVPGAWLAGLVFAVHPVNVATAAWISEQKNTLSMLFCAVTILLYLRFYDDKQWRWYVLSLGAFLLALLSKSAVVMLPFVLLGCVWWLRGQIRPKDILCSIPFFVASLTMGLVTVWFQHYRALGGEAVRPVGFIARLATAGWVPWFYLWKALLPINLTVIYPVWNIDPAQWTAWVPGIFLIGCFVLLWSKRTTWGRPLLFGLGYFVVTLFPVLGFFEQGLYRSTLVADHWQYYSIVGIIALVVAAGERILGHTVVGAVAVLMVLGVATWKRSSIYASTETLWRDNVTKYPNASMAHYNLGVNLDEAGRFQEAADQYEQVLRIEPDAIDAHSNLGVDLWRAGRIPEAIEHYKAALQIKPDFAEAHYNWALALAQGGHLQEAVEHYQRALQIKPDNAQIHYNLGNTLAEMRRLDDAVGHYEQALRLKPDYAEAQFNLGMVLEQQGKMNQAMKSYQQALAIRPGMVDAENALARLRGGPSAGAQPDTR